MLIDVHAHLMLDGHDGATFALDHMFTGLDKLEQFASAFWHADIDRVILCADPYWLSPNGCNGDPVGAVKRANDAVAEACARFPDLFSGSVVVNPDHIDCALKEISERIEKQGFVGVGEICQYVTEHDTDTEGMREVLRLAAKLDVPTNIHSSNTEHTDGLRSLMNAVPDATVIMAHIGGYRNWRNGIELTREFPDLYVDISGIVVQYGGTLAAALKGISHDRLVFGVDYPLIEPESMTGPFYAAAMSDESRRKIASENALRIYKRMPVAVPA